MKREISKRLDTLRRFCQTAPLKTQTTGITYFADKMGFKYKSMAPAPSSCLKKLTTIIKLAKIAFSYERYAIMRNRVVSIFLLMSLFFNIAHAAVIS
ncbi:MAG: hypothetical protein L3J47_12225, partial [Sulfurovum sp.]|nr:hypothetical protein [Sulfurovum sp.]